MNNYFMKMAYILAQESKCVSMKVGAILTRDKRIISTGINGTPSGYINCNSLFKERSKEHSEWSNIHEIHAEMNCLLSAARNGISTNNTIIYITHEPCQQCLKNMMQAGVKGIYYGEPYYRETEAEKIIKHKFIEKSKAFHFYTKLPINTTEE